MKTRRTGRWSSGHGNMGRARVRPILAVAAAVILSGCGGLDVGLRQGDPAPEFEASHLVDGSSLAISDFLGQPVLVNLWATWCVPCRTETPYLQSIYEEYRERGLHMVGVSVDTEMDLDLVEAFIDEMGVTYDIVLDPEGTSERIFSARGLPNSILIDANGIVAFSWLGPIEEGDPTFLRGLESVLD